MTKNRGIRGTQGWQVACYLLYRPVWLFIFMLGNDRDREGRALSTFQASMRALGMTLLGKAYEFIVWQTGKLCRVTAGQIVWHGCTRESS